MNRVYQQIKDAVAEKSPLTWDELMERVEPRDRQNVLKVMKSGEKAGDWQRVVKVENGRGVVRIYAPNDAPQSGGE